MKKRTLFFLAFFNLLAFNSVLLAQDVLANPDSLFSQKKFQAASLAYYQLIRQSQTIEIESLLKMALSGEFSGQYAYTLLALSLLSEAGYSKANEKLNQLIRLYDLEGYQYTDKQFFISFYTRYYSQIGLGFALVALLWVFLIFRQTKAGRSRFGLTVVAVIWLFAMAAILNLIPEQKYGISLENNVLLMSQPSHAASVVEQLKMGERIKILASEGYWTQILWRDKVCYVKSSLLVTSL